MNHDIIDIVICNSILVLLYIKYFIVLISLYIIIVLTIAINA